MDEEGEETKETFWEISSKGEFYYKLSKSMKFRITLVHFKIKSEEDFLSIYISQQHQKISIKHLSPFNCL